jgi:hypothetical protein
MEQTIYETERISPSEWTLYGTEALQRLPFTGCMMGVESTPKIQKKTATRVTLNDHWIERPEELGLTWSCKAKTSTLRSKSGKA